MIGEQMEQTIKSLIYHKGTSKGCPFTVPQSQNARNQLILSPNSFIILSDEPLVIPMRQRAIIAMALACNAELIIADEPTTALDVTIQAQIMQILKEIKKEKHTAILLITHDLAVVYQNANIVSVMYAGNIVESAKTDEFFKNTNHPYSIGLLKSLPENRNKKLFAIKGHPPMINDNINGCKFHNRCEFNIPDLCCKKTPELMPVGENHCSACFLN